MSWRRLVRRRQRRVEDRSDAGPVELGGVWYAGGVPARPGVWMMAARAWGRRAAVVGRSVRRLAGWVSGLEARSGAERRAITSLPWVQGGPRPSAAYETSPERALRLAPVFAAGRLLSTMVASLPIEVFRQTPNGRVKLPLPPLLQSPSLQGTLHDWKVRAMTSLIYRGNAIGLITARDRLEYPTMVEWLNPAWVQVIDSIPFLGQPGSFTNPIWFYLGRELPQEDLVHIPWVTLPQKVLGLSPIGAYATTVTTGLAAREYSAEWFESGGVPPGTFQNSSQVVGQEDAEVIKARLVSAIRKREPIVYGKDWKYTPITISAAEAKFIDTMKLGATEIASIYGIPPERIGGETGRSMTYSNAEMDAIDFVTFTLLPWLTKIEDALSALLPRGQYVKFNVDSMLRADMKTLIEAFEKMRLIGMTNVDELRDRVDMAPLPNGQGQDYTPLPLAAGQPIHAPQVRADGGPEADGTREIPQPTVDAGEREEGRGPVTLLGPAAARAHLLARRDDPWAA